MAAVAESDCGLFVSGKPSHPQPVRHLVHRSLSEVGSLSDGGINADFTMRA